MSLNKKEEYIRKPMLMLAQAREMLRDLETAAPLQCHKQNYSVNSAK